MAVYNWPKIMEMKSDEELQDFANHVSGEYNEEVISVAQKEIDKRKEKEIFNLEPEFPEKPEPNESNQSLKKSIYSLVLFVAAFYVIFRWDFKYIFVLIGIILIHEIGHYIAMRIFKYKDLGIFFVPLVGALVIGEKEDISQKQKVIISLAGPLPGLIIGSVLEVIGLNSNNEFLTQTADLFIFLNLFNLLPIIPLDGGQIIRNLFFQSNEKINTVFLWISIAVMGFLALNSQSYVLLIVPLFLFLQIKNQSQINMVRKIANEKGISTNKNFSELSNEEYWLLRDELAVNFRGLTNLIEAKRYIQVPAENRVINVVKQVIKKQPIKDVRVGGKILFMFIWIFSFLIPVAALAYYVLVLDGSIS